MTTIHDRLRILSLVFLITFLLPNLVLMTGCEETTEEVYCEDGTQETEEIRGALVRVIFPDGPGPCNISTDYSIEEGDTALSVLLDYGKDTGIPVALSEDGSRVIGIKTVFEKDLGDTFAWIYEVNGDPYIEDAGEYQLAQGDQVIWRYVDLTTY